MGAGVNKTGKRKSTSMKAKDKYDRVRDIINRGGVVALTGAGISKESGIPTFREKGGLWDRYDPSIYGSIVGLSSLFLFKPHRIRDFIVDIYEEIISAAPKFPMPSPPMMIRLPFWS